jgi:hypothetical protein
VTTPTTSRWPCSSSGGGAPRPGRRASTCGRAGARALDVKPGVPQARLEAPWPGPRTGGSAPPGR